MIAIIGAMDEEVAMLKEKMTEVQVESRACMEFYKGKLEGKDTVVVRSGIGKVNAAMCAQILADRYAPSCIINTGIAGSLDARINIGDIVISTDALQHDMDARAFGYEAGQIPRVDTLSFPADETLVTLAKECCSRVNPEIGTFTEMEGAAIAQVCYFNRIPFLILRAISDKADDSAGVDYAVFEAQAIRHSVNLMTEMVRCM